MVVIGGSNSAGGGVHNPRLMYFNQVAEWWNNTTGSNLTVVNTSVGGTGSDFFLFCLENVLPQGLQPDIVLVDTSVNDFGYKYGKAAQPMELLTRRLLLLPSRPLVMYVNFILPVFVPFTQIYTNVDCLNMQDLGFDELAKHYGIPSFSIKDLACPLSSSKKRKLYMSLSVFSEDKIHAGYKSHEKIASMIINYLKDVLKKVPGSTTEIESNQNNMPSLVKPLFSDPSISDDQLSNAMCWSHLTNNWKIPLKQTLDANLTESRGFRYLTPEESDRLSINHTAHRTDAYGGWVAKPNKTEYFLKFKFHIPNNVTSGSVAVIFRIVKTKDVHIGLLLDNKNVTTVYFKKCGGSLWKITYLYPLATNIRPGYHSLSIVSDIGGNVVSGIIVGYSSYFPGYESYRPINLNYWVWSYKQFLQHGCRPEQKLNSNEAPVEI